MTTFEHEHMIGVVNATNPADVEVTWYRRGSEVEIDPATFGARKLRVTSVGVSCTTAGSLDVYFGPSGIAAARRIANVRALDASRVWRREEAPIGPAGASAFVTSSLVGAATVILFAELDP